MDENLYVTNLNSFKVSDKEYLDFFQDYYDLGNLEEVDYTVEVETIENRKVLYLLKEGNIIQLDSMYDSNTILNKWYEQLENANYRSRYIMFGFGNGMYIKKLLEKTEVEAEIIVVEPSVQIFAKVIKEFDVSNILGSERVHLVIAGIGDKTFRNILEEYVKFDDLLGMVKKCYLNFPNLFKKNYIEFIEAIEFHADLLNANETVLKRMGAHYLLNSLANHLFVKDAKSIIDLNKKIPKNIPAILVSAGPSLDKNVVELKKAKNKSFIMAVDTAAVALVENGVIPDMIICIDAMKSYKHLKNPLVQQIPLLCFLHSNCSVLELHQGDKYFMQNDNYHIKAFFDKIGKVAPEIEGGGSVANSAFAFLERMGFRTIILVGQDLAYTNGKTHSVATVTGKEKTDLEDKHLTYIDDIKGEPILISREFQIYLDWFVEELKAHPQYRVIDATEGGAKIEGTKIQSLKSAIKNECVEEVNIDEIMSNIVYRFDEREKNEYINYMEKLPNEMKIISNWIAEVIAIYKKMLKNIASAKLNIYKIQKDFKRSSVLVEQIETNPAFYYLHCSVQSKLEEFRTNDLYGTETNQGEDMRNSVNRALDYMKILQDEVEYCNYLIVNWLEVVYQQERKRKIIMPMDFK